jgi:hypothetical protein
MVWRTLCLLLSLCISQLARAQESRLAEAPLRVTICQLESAPDAYDRKLVEVRGRVIYSKFDFEMDSSCRSHGRAIWLDFGGDLLSPAYAPNWNLGPFLAPKPPGKDVRVRGLPVPLVHNALLDQLVNDFRAMRARMPNGRPCGYECLFYDVTATVKARFFSASKGAFGFENCCHLLVIQRVLDVTSKRTTVPAGGEFQCTTDRWQLSDEDRKSLAKIPACSLRANPKGCYPTIARHWGDQIKPSDELRNDRAGWTSSDMTRSYYFGGNFVQLPGGKGAELAPDSVATRTVCRATTPPAPRSDHVLCDFYRQVFPQDKTADLAALASVNAGAETWRTSDLQTVAWAAFENARKEWKLGPATPLKLEKCQHNPMPKDPDGTAPEYGYCIWLSSDQMQELTVTLGKPSYLVKPAGGVERTPWIAREVEFHFCRTVPRS